MILLSSSSIHRMTGSAGALPRIPANNTERREMFPGKLVSKTRSLQKTSLHSFHSQRMISRSTYTHFVNKGSDGFTHPIEVDRRGNFAQDSRACSIFVTSVGRKIVYHLCENGSGFHPGSVLNNVVLIML